LKSSSKEKDQGLLNRGLQKDNKPTLSNNNAIFKSFGQRLNPGPLNKNDVKLPKEEKIEKTKNLSPAQKNLKDKQFRDSEDLADKSIKYTEKNRPKQK